MERDQMDHRSWTSMASRWGVPAPAMDEDYNCLLWTRNSANQPQPNERTDPFTPQG